MNKLLTFIVILIVVWGCTEEPLAPEIVFVHDTLITVIHDTTLTFETDTVIVATYTQISISPRAVGFWEKDNLYAVLFGNGINISDDIIDSVSIEFTVTADVGRENILSESIGYFLPESPPFRYVPNDPFPYKIQHNLEPDAVNYIYVAADTLEGIDSAFWYFRLIVEDSFFKRASSWQYGGIIER